VATIRVSKDCVLVSGMNPDGSQFRKTYSRKRFGSGFKKIAQQKYEELLFDNSVLNNPGNSRKTRSMHQMTVRDLGIKYVEEHLSYTRAKGNKSYVDVIINKWGKWRLNQINVGVVRPWIRSYLDGTISKGSEKYSAVYVKKLIRYFQRIFNWGCEGDLIDNNPLRYLIDHSLRKEFSRRIKPRRAIISREEFNKIIDPAPLWFQRVCRHAWCTGMRQGEIASLKWESIKDGLIYLESDTTKEADTKVIPLEPEVADQLEAIKLEQSVEGQSDFVYLGPSGQVMPPIRISDAWRWYRDKANLKKLRFHDIRRTWENRKEEEGFSLRVIAAAMGHHSTDTTARHYRSVSEAEIRSLSGCPPIKKR
jgi:integrase